MRDKFSAGNVASLIVSRLSSQTGRDGWEKVIGDVDEQGEQSHSPAISRKECQQALTSWAQCLSPAGSSVHRDFLRHS